MEIKFFFKDEQIERLFTSLGFEVYDEIVPGKVGEHGRKMPDEKRRMVEMPQSGEAVTIECAASRLIQYKMLSELYWVDKMMVLNALHGVEIENPLDEIRAPECVVSE